MHACCAIGGVLSAFDEASVVGTWEWLGIDASPARC